MQYYGEIRDEDTILRLSSGPDLNLLKVDECVQWTLNGTAIPIIHFHTDDARALHERLKAGGVSVEPLIDQSWVGFSFEMYDPDRNKILVWQANDLIAKPRSSPYTTKGAAEACSFCIFRRYDR